MPSADGFRFWSMAASGEAPTFSRRSHWVRRRLWSDGARFVGLPQLVVNGGGILNELPPVADLKKVLEAAGVSDDSRVILYGDASVLPATRAYFTLDYLGHGDQAALLDGGLEKWRAEGRTLSKDATVAVVGHFTPHPKPELVVQIDAVKQMAGKPAGSSAEVLLDVRP